MKGRDPRVLVLWKWNGVTHHRYCRASQVSGVKAWCCRRMPGHYRFRVEPDNRTKAEKKVVS